MAIVRRLVLDILKPHQPNVLTFSNAIADVADCAVKVVVLEVDEHTETLRVEIEGDNLDFATIEKAIADAGASLHSIDEVAVVSKGGEA